MIRVAINGYGRIGRVAHRVILERFADQIQIVAINTGKSTDAAGWAYLLKYDTSYGILKNHIVKSEEKKLIVDGVESLLFSEKDPSLLPWKDLQVDVVIECTGEFTTMEKVKPHLDAGAKKVVLSAPAKDSAIHTFVLDVNLTAEPTDQVISNASCTTNCIAPIAQIMVEKFGVVKAMMTTIHAYTTDQRLQDGGHKDYRRARAAAANIVPTSTGATIAAAEAVPELKGLFTGSSIRVPVVVGSLSDFTFQLKRPTTVEEINTVLKEAANSLRYSHILEASEDPLVSSDIVGNSHSAIVDLSLTQVVGGDLAKVFAWYDNEWGYANRLVEEVVLVGQ
ncbi:type I glyceraldehyde-3-phosphate dehydrogenase [Candidatus Microgenomates bacterium]|nr:type I glyceraldehyde-3-phosphate dehydrogenase [Candidatus Microgenomates bacterium]